MSDEQEIKLACLHQAGGNLDHAKDLFAWVAGTSTAERQRDELFAETKRAQAIIDGLRPHRDLVEYLSILDDPEEADDWASGVQAFAKVIREAKQIFGVTAALDTISALTPPLQHKGGETEVGSRLAAFKERFQGFIKADLPEGYIAWEGGACPAEISDPIGPVPYVELKFSDGDTHGTRLAHTYNWTGKSSDLSIEPHIIGYRIFSSSEADSGPGSEAPAGDARIEQTISTLQASSGEGETDETELAAFLRLEGAVKHNGGPRPIPVGSHMEMLTRGCGVWPVRNIEEFSSHWHWDGEEEHPTNIIAYRPIEAPASSTLSTTEPAAYSPVNNADVPFIDDTVAGSFAWGKDRELELAAEDAKRKAAEEKPGFRLFGGIGAFGKREVI